MPAATFSPRFIWYKVFEKVESSFYDNNRYTSNSKRSLKYIYIHIYNVWNFDMYYCNCYFIFVLIWNRKRPELALHAIRLVHRWNGLIPPSLSFLFLSFLSGCILFSCWIWWSPVKILLEFWFISMLLTGWK